jgi:hypothetical protein
MPHLGLVTVLYKSDDVLEEFFQSLHIQSYRDYHLYIIDNSPSSATDSVMAHVSKKYPLPGFTHIKAEGNIGVAAGNNRGIQAAQLAGCDHVLLLHNDILIEQPFMLERIMEVGRTEDLVTVKIFYHDSRLIWMAGGYMDDRRALGVHYGMKKPDGPAYNKAGHVTYAPTCFLLIKTALFDAVGMMDEKYFAYYDDTDFVLRCIRKGYRIWYEPSLYLYHKVSSSSGGDFSPFYAYYGNRNKIYFIRKNYKGLQKASLLAYTFLTRMGFYLRYNAAGKKKLLQAMRDGFRMKPHSD